MSFSSQGPHMLFGRPIEAIVEPVDIFDAVGKAVSVDVLDRRDLHRNDRRAAWPNTLRMGAYPAVRAEMIGQVRLGFAFGRPAVVGQGVGAFLEPESFSGHEGEPGARLAAQRAIAAQGPLLEVDIDRIGDGAAMTAPMPGFAGHD